MARILAVVAVLALAACGGDDVTAPDTVTVDTEELRAAVQDARDAAQNTLQDVVGATSRDEAAGALRSGAEQLREAAERLEAAEAPEDARAARDDLADASRALADEFEVAAPSVERGDLADLFSSVQSFASVERFNEALADLRAQGLDVPEVDAG